MPVQFTLEGFTILALMSTTMLTRGFTEEQKLIPPCERGYECDDGGCDACNGARHHLSQNLQPYLPGLEVQGNLHW